MNAVDSNDPNPSMLTPKARQRVTTELALLRQRQQELAAGLSNDAPLGDRGDQAIELESVDMLAWVGERITELTLLLENPNVLPTAETAPGSTVTLQHADGSTETLRVGFAFEQDGPITVVTPESPVGQALRGHGVGDTIAYVTPSRQVRARITAIDPAQD